jgi:phosphatidylethanolamine-binding protein (PEBP) family uncharacterized protein
MGAGQRDRVTESSRDVPECGGTIGTDHVFNGFGCSGKNISPALAWSGAPAGDKPHRYVFTLWALKVD